MGRAGYAATNTPHPSLCCEILRLPLAALVCCHLLRRDCTSAPTCDMGGCAGCVDSWADSVQRAAYSNSGAFSRSHLNLNPYSRANCDDCASAYLHTDGAA